MNIFKKIILAVLIFESKLILKKYKPKIIAVTGSVGKTSTKDAIYFALRPFVHIRKSEKSFNSEIGVPLSIIGCDNAWKNPLLWLKNIFTGFLLIILKNDYPKYLVLEVGADQPGDIKSIAKWLAPDAVVITRFPDVPAHIEFFESREHVIEEKMELPKALKPEQGLLVLNADDPDVHALRAGFNVPVVTYGFSMHADVRATEPQIVYDENKIPLGIKTDIYIKSMKFPFAMEGVLGHTHLASALAGIALVYKNEFKIEEGLKSLSSYPIPKGRMSLLLGINNSVILDDTYNSSPAACESAIRTLKSLEARGRKIAVLGDMLELGKFTSESHKIMGREVKEVADILITVGIRSKVMGESAIEVGMPKENVIHFSNSIEAGEYLKENVKEGDVVLLKASQGMRMEKAVKEILANKEEAVNLLVRQEKEWLSR